MSQRHSFLRCFAPAVATLLMMSCASNRHGPILTTRPTPVAVTVAAEPNPNETLGNPAFDALPGAIAHFGRLGGSIYQIEIPKNWNKRLVLYMHGQTGKFEPVLNAAMPPNRHDLINQGYAWAASSFSRGDFNFGTGAEETAALWDHFVDDLGRPEHTYVFGGSAGGASALIAASKYADRIDGILAACPGPGTRPDIQYIGDTVVAALYAAGVSQDQFHAADARAFVANSLLPSLEDPAVHRRSVDTWIQLTGGARPYAEEGLTLQENYLLTFGAKLIAYGTIDNTKEVYRASDGSNALSDLNERAVRISSPSIDYAAEIPDNIEGAFKVPVLALYASGDAIVPISTATYVRSLVDSAGSRDMLAQRFVDSAEHCGFQNSDYDRALTDLVAWMEQAKAPTP